MNMKFLIILIAFCALTGIGPVLLHHDTYEARKQAEWQVFQECAIPPDAIEVGDNSYEKYKTITIIKKYKVSKVKEQIEKYYQEKLTSTGWERIENKDGVHYRRSDLAIFIEYDMPIVEVSLVYVGDDKGL